MIIIWPKLISLNEVCFICIWKVEHVTSFSFWFLLTQISKVSMCHFSSPDQSAVHWTDDWLNQSSPRPFGPDWIFSPADWTSPFHTLSSTHDTGSHHQVHFTSIKPWNHCAQSQRSAMDSKHRAVPTTLVRGRRASGLTRPITEWRPGSPRPLLVAGSWPGALVLSIGLSISFHWLPTRGVQKVRGPTMKEQRYELDTLDQKCLFIHVNTVQAHIFLTALHQSLQALFEGMGLEPIQHV